MIYEFTDREYAVIVDSLSAMRDTLRAGGHPTPTVDAVIEKFGKWARPEGCEFLAVTGEDADLIRQVVTTAEQVGER